MCLFCNPDGFLSFLCVYLFIHMCTLSFLCVALCLLHHFLLPVPCVFLAHSLSPSQWVRENIKTFPDDKKELQPPPYPVFEVDLRPLGSYNLESDKMLRTVVFSRDRLVMFNGDPERPEFKTAMQKVLLPF